MNNSENRVRVRIAPSPTGPPHVGTAYIALFDYVFATQRGGDFVLRIEDTDRQRSTRESEEAILDALRWLGLRWDEGPDIGGPHGPYRQSERGDIYREHAQRLLDSGAVYRCFCSPERLAELRGGNRRGPGAGYDRRCRELSEDQIRRNLDAAMPYTLRLKAPLDGETAFEDGLRGRISVRNDQVEDLILLKSDGLPTYHLANVVDDHLMEITHVVRAEEWISSTPKHILIYRSFGWTPPEFIHMPLLRNKDKTKISKRKNPTSLDWYREQGFLPEAMLNFLGLMGWSLSGEREKFSLQEMIDSFSWDSVKTTGPVFDLEKLKWLNGEYIRELSSEQILQRLIQGHYTTHLNEPAEKLLLIIQLLQQRIKSLGEFDESANFFFEREHYPAEDLIPKKQGPDFPAVALAAARDALEPLSDWSAGAIQQTMERLAENREWKRGALYMPVRVAVTCRKVSTPLFETMEILGRQECLQRFEEALHKAASLEDS
ncbi:MAG: glutamate--tRNA ligase [Planctomycetes bacterium]|nr:glutamate--tRNA ligase [Planctomycetota bacterium]